MIKHIVFSILMFICSLSIYSDVPNEVITKNPKKEVTTVNSEKNRDHANMSITVNKINLIDIEGVEVQNSILFTIPQDKDKVLKKDEYIVVKSLNNIEVNNSNKRRKQSNEIEKISSETIVNENNTVIKINKDNSMKEIYIIKKEANSDKIIKVYRGKILNPKYDKYDTTFWNQILRLEVNSNNAIKQQTITKNTRIWKDTYWLDSVRGGFNNSRLVLQKIGDSNDRIEVDVRRHFLIQGICPLNDISRKEIEFGNLSGAGAYHRNDGGFRFVNVLNLWNIDSNGQTSLWGGSDVDVLTDYIISSTQSSYKGKGGYFYIKNPFNLVLLLSGGDWKWREHLIPDNLAMIVPRAAMTAEININKNQLNDLNTISFMDSGLTEKLGYTDDGNKTTYEILESNANGKIILDSTGIQIANDLPSGRYTLKVNWKVTEKNFEGLDTRISIGDTIIINYNANDSIDIGTFIFKLDRRILSDKSDLNWIYSNGNITRRIINYSQNNYKEFVTVIDNLKNLSSVKAIDVLEVEGRPIRFNSFTSADNGKEYRNYLAHEIPDYRDEAAIPYEMPLSELSKYFIVSRNNGSLLDNKFKLLGEDQKIYIGNVKEEYIGDNAFESSGEIDLTSLNIGEYASWNQYGQSGNLINTSGTQGKTIVLKMVGNLFNLKSVLNLSGNHIVTKLKVTKNGITQEVNGNIGEKIQVENEDNIIGIDINGFYVHKKTSKSIPIDYKIEAYYNEILLGSLELTVLNNKEIPIGEVVLNLDNRVREGLKPIWFSSKKKASQGISNQQTDYKEVIGVEGNFNNLDNKIITRVDSVEGKEFTHNERNIENIEYSVFSVKGRPNVVPSAIPTNINLQDLKNNLIVARDRKQDRLDGNNKFKVQTEDNILYSGNIRENYTGEYAIKGTANIDLTTLDLNDFVGWNQVSQNGNLQNTMGTSGKIITLEGQLFNWKSALNPTGNHIVNRLVVTKGNEQPIEVTGSIGNPIQIENEDNIIGISNEGLYVQKKSYNSKNINYLIQAYYNDIFLGEVRLGVLNNKKVNIGYVAFNLDKRLINRDNREKGSWVFFNGDNYSQFVDSNKINFGKVNELFSTAGDFVNIDSTIIRTVETIEGYNRRYWSTGEKDSIKYDVYADSNITWENESAMPKGINLLDLKENLVISTWQSGSDIDNNNFILRGENGILYSGNVRENYRGMDSLHATATLDMKIGKLKTEGIWKPKSVGNVKSLGEVPYILKIVEGRLFDTRGINGDHSIVTRLVIKENGKEIGKDEGEIRETREVKLKDNIIGIDGSTGNFYIKKLTHNHEEKNYEIEIYYREILLGTLDLKVENGYGFAITDGDIIDFGDLFPGDIKQAVTTIEVFNPLQAKIKVKLDPSSKNEMYLEKESGIDTNIKIPIKDIQVTALKGSGRNTSSFKMSATAVTNSDTKTGNYNGELEVVITIIP